VARLATPVRRLRRRDHAVRCNLEPGDDGMWLHPQDAQESHMIAHAASADALAMVAAGDGDAAAGDLVPYLVI
jgi:molybdopterin biosynthesis enzyme